MANGQAVPARHDPTIVQTWGGSPLTLARGGAIKPCAPARETLMPPDQPAVQGLICPAAR